MKRTPCSWRHCLHACADHGRGAGSRLNLGEKPLILINNQPMIRYVIDAFSGAGCEVVVATSSKTPMTRNWCRVNGIDSYDAVGADYIPDMVETVQALGETKPLFVSVSDIPCIDPDIIRTVSDLYRESGKGCLFDMGSFEDC